MRGFLLLPYKPEKARVGDRERKGERGKTESQPGWPTCQCLMFVKRR